jgi:hypothetical protein
MLSMSGSKTWGLIVAVLVAAGGASSGGCSSSGSSAADTGTDDASEAGASNADDGSTIDGTAPLDGQGAAGDGGQLPAPAGCIVDAGGSVQSGGALVLCDGGGVDAGDFVGVLSACLSGALSEAFVANGGNGTIGASTLDWTYFPSTTSPVHTDFLVHLSGGYPVDQIGSVGVDSVEITGGGDADAGVLDWKTPAGSCTLTITSSECSPNAVRPTRRVIAGNGACSRPAAPQGGTGAGPVDIGSFAFRTFLAP